jgi:hypothetical protein
MPSEMRLALRVDIEDDGFDLLADLHQLADGCLTRLVHVISLTWTRPSTPCFEFDEGAVVGQADHLALDAGRWVLLVSTVPRVFLSLLQAEADALALRIVLETTLTSSGRPRTSRSGG